MRRKKGVIDISLQNFSTNVFGNDWHRRSAGNDTQKIVPSPSNASTMFLNEFLQWDAHLVFDNTRVIHMAADAIQLSSRISFSSKTSKPATTTPADSGRNCYSLHIRNSSRAFLPRYPAA